MLLWTLVHLPFHISGFIFVGCKSRSGIAGSYGNCVFNVLKTLHTVLHSGCTDRHPHQHCARVSFSPTVKHGLHSQTRLDLDVTQSCPTLRPHGLHSPWNSPGQNAGVGSLSLLQGIFPTQGSNPGLPHCRWILYQLRHKENPRILGLVAYPFSSRFSQPRNWTRVSCIAGGFFTNWAIKEAPFELQVSSLLVLWFGKCNWHHNLSTSICSLWNREIPALLGLWEFQ